MLLRSTPICARSIDATGASVSAAALLTQRTHQAQHVHAQPLTAQRLPAQLHPSASMQAYDRPKGGSRSACWHCVRSYADDPSVAQAKMCRRIVRSVERSLRHLVISRKASGGTRSVRGTESKTGPGLVVRHLASPEPQPTPRMQSGAHLPSTLVTVTARRCLCPGRPGGVESHQSETTPPVEAEARRRWFPSPSHARCEMTTSDTAASNLNAKGRFRLPDPPEREPDDMTSFDRLADNGNAHHLKQFLGQPETTIVSGEKYITARPRTERRYPDLLVAFGADQAAYRETNGYVVSEQGKPPDWVLEIASEGTGRNDVEDKREFYRRLGIGEYWRFDQTPTGQWHGARLAGDLLVDGEYIAIEIETLQDGSLQGYSPVLNLYLRWVDGELAFYDPATTQPIASFESERTRANAERARADTAEARVRELEERLRQRG